MKNYLIKSIAMLCVVMSFSFGDYSLKYSEIPLCLISWDEQTDTQIDLSSQERLFEKLIKSATTQEEKNRLLVNLNFLYAKEAGQKLSTGLFSVFFGSGFVVVGGLLAVGQISQKKPDYTLSTMAYILGLVFEINGIVNFFGASGKLASIQVKF